MAVAEFDTFGPVVRTQRSFIVAWYDFVGVIRDVRLPDPMCSARRVSPRLVVVKIRTSMPSRTIQDRNRASGPRSARSHRSVDRMGSGTTVGGPFFPALS